MPRRRPKPTKAEAEGGAWSETTLFDVTSPKPAYRTYEERRDAVIEAGKLFEYFTDQSAALFEATFANPELTPLQRSEILAYHAQSIGEHAHYRLVLDGVRIIADPVPEGDSSLQ